MTPYMKILLLTLIYIKVDEVSSLTCLFCDAIEQPRHCKTVIQCASGQECFAEKFTNRFGEQRYNLGCTQSPVCPHADINLGHTCTQCCHGDLCNAALCGETSFPTPRGPICYNCPKYTSTCHDIEFCNIGEECSVSGTLEFGDEVLASGCRPSQTCGSSGLGSLIGRRDTERADRTVHQYTCNSCCKTDLCNANCTGLSATTSIPMMSTTTHIGLIDFGKYRDCSEIKTSGNSRGNGLYRIYPTGSSSVHVDVLCDMTTDGGGWTVFQYRFDGKVDFYRNFHDYVNGFGQYPGEYWLGLRWIYMLTSSRAQKLRIDVVADDGDKGWMKYEFFNLTDHYNYTIHTENYTGNTGNKMARQEGYGFTTFDHDVDNGSDFTDQNCAKSFKGGWWYSNCFDSNLNALYQPGVDDSSSMSLNDWSGHSSYDGLKATQMAVRPV